MAWPGCPTLTGCENFGAPVSGPFDGLTRSGLGRTSPFRDEGGKGLESERRAHYPASPKGRVTRGKRSFTLAAGPSAHAPEPSFVARARSSRPRWKSGLPSPRSGRWRCAVNGYIWVDHEPVV